MRVDLQGVRGVLGETYTVVSIFTAGLDVRFQVG